MGELKRRIQALKVGPLHARIFKTSGPVLLPRQPLVQAFVSTGAKNSSDRKPSANRVADRVVFDGLAGASFVSRRFLNSTASTRVSKKRWLRTLSMFQLTTQGLCC